MSMEFKTQGANVPLCNAEKHNVHSTEHESDSVYIDIADKLLVKEELKILISGGYCSTVKPINNYLDTAIYQLWCCALQLVLLAFGSMMCSSACFNQLEKKKY